MTDTAPSAKPPTPAIYALAIQRFRGIATLQWKPSRGVNVILGGGDVGKTTILEAIALLFSPVNPTTLSDPDYHDRDIEAGFSIEAVLSLPAGAGISSQMKPSWPWDWSGEEATVPSLEHDGKLAGEPVYRVRVRGTEDLELAYEIVQPDGSADSFPVALRRAIGLVRLSGDDRNDRDLRLVQGSALDRLLSDKGLRSRMASELAKNDVKNELTTEAQAKLKILDTAFKRESLPAGLDLAITGGQGASIESMIGLTADRHGIQLPLASWGAGTRRLSALAIAEQNQGDAPITLVDEVERGLEPYRQRTLIEKLQTGSSQVFLTTHSPAAISSAATSSIWYVDHTGQIGPLDATKIAKHRKTDPEAFLSRLAIIAEGATELGFIAAILERVFGSVLEQHGVHVSDGGGHEATLGILEALAAGGLQFGGFADDEGKHPTRWAKLQTKLGGLLFRWPSLCIEENIIAVVPDDKLEAFIADPSGEKTGIRLRTLADRQEASQQGKAGLRLQHALPDARVVYVSATGATSVHNLAYAQRLGLWGGEDFPFATRQEFVEAIEAGGVAAMEVLARDLKALGLYMARSLSYQGVEYEMLEHRLTLEQIRIYDSYAGAFQIIHNNLNAALEAANITGPKGTLNKQAKSAARSAFEGSKQRFFGHLITAMKVPSLIAAVDADLSAGHAAIIQIVSTGEALMERRLSAIPTGEWNDVQVDITPREYVLDYLCHSFPTQLFEPFTDDAGILSSRPVFRDGQPVQCRDAIKRRDRLIEHLAALAPVQGALDQIVQRFGTDVVAEVTGRSRRIVRKPDSQGFDRLAVENRAGSANLAEAQAFMDDQKRILVFSDAGGTGRSYHADLGAKNQRLRVHYLLEAGWKADAAIQGLGRSNRTNQAQPPLFRPVSTDVRGEKRFLSTIARRLDTLGAITKGQRQTGGQGLFRADDNLESYYARAALRQFYFLLYAGKIEGCTLGAFQDATGLKLTDSDGSLLEDLPPITTFLNRLLALRIDLQNSLFAAFESLLRGKIEGAIAAGVYEAGLETVTADSLKVTTRRTVYVHGGSGAETRVFSVARRDRNRPLSLDEALAHAEDSRSKFLVNAQSGRAALQVPAPHITLDDGEVERRVRLIRPMERTAIGLNALAETQWRESGREEFAGAWSAELADVPEYSTGAFHVVTGLLLPIWKRIPEDSMRVYRLQTDEGERIIGRLLSPASLNALFENLRDADAPPLSPADAWEAVLDGKAQLQLADGLSLRRARIMNAGRVELVGFTEGMVDRLKAMGLMTEIISWKLRMFVPTGEAGPRILAAVIDRHPLVRVGALESRADVATRDGTENRHVCAA